MIETRKIGWEELEILIRKVAKFISSQGQFDAVVGVARGGLVCAGMLAVALGSPNLHSIRVIHYGEGKPPNELFSHPVVERPDFETQGRSFVLVDDIISTGMTLEEAKMRLLQMGSRRVLTASVFAKPHPRFPPDFFSESEARCVIFPWEERPIQRRKSGK